LNEPWRIAVWSLSGDERTSGQRAQNDAIDPSRHFATINCRIAKGSFDHLVDAAGPPQQLSIGAVRPQSERSGHCVIVGNRSSHSEHRLSAVLFIRIVLELQGVQAGFQVSIGLGGMTIALQ
jgi:hypothetical protein